MGVGLGLDLRGGGGGGALFVGTGSSSLSEGVYGGGAAFDALGGGGGLFLKEPDEYVRDGGGESEFDGEAEVEVVARLPPF